MVVTRTEDAGDGTVPFWSALPRAVQKQVVVNEHSKIFHGMSFNRVFYRLLGGDLGVPLESLGLQEKIKAVRLSIPTPVINADASLNCSWCPDRLSKKSEGFSGSRG
jgi:phospholipase A1